jgi:glycerol-3-phosphate dehydrogenase (NAD(P)+)
MEQVISFGARSIKHKAILVDVSKGVEPHTLKIITTVISKHVRPELRKNIVSISGPAVAGQMVNGQYTAMNIASKNPQAIKKVKAVLENHYLKLIPTTDMVGVEIGGSFKNVYAVATGICDGLKLGLNTKAAILTYALEEIADLIQAMGGRRRTAYELAGLGDLIGTSLCPESRNRTFGEYMGKGIRASLAIKKMKQTVEGYNAAQALLALAKRHKVKAPFAHVIGACLEAKDPRVVFKRFLERM